jgi:hypothetical protein
LPGPSGPTKNKKTFKKWAQFLRSGLSFRVERGRSVVFVTLIVCAYFCSYCVTSFFRYILPQKWTIGI